MISRGGTLSGPVCLRIPAADCKDARHVRPESDSLGVHQRSRVYKNLEVIRTKCYENLEF